VVWIGTSQALKYDVITYILYECINYTILDKIASLWKRIGIGCYRGGPGQQRYSGSSYDLFWLNNTVRRLRHWNFHLLSFWLALLWLCDVSYVIINEKFSWQLHWMLSNVRHRAVITPVSPLLTRLIYISPSCWTICRSFEIILEMGTVHWITLQIQWSIYTNSLLQKTFSQVLIMFQNILNFIGLLRP